MSFTAITRKFKVLWFPKKGRHWAKQKSYQFSTGALVRKEPHTLSNWVTHRSQNFRLSRDYPYVRTFKRQNKNKRVSRSSNITLGITLILDINVGINLQLSRKAIRWPVPSDHIAGSGQELIEVPYLLKLTADQVLGFSIGSRSQACYYSGKEWSRVYMQMEFRRKSNTDALLTFLPTYFLDNRLLKTSWYIAFVISTILGTVMNYGF